MHAAAWVHSQEGGQETSLAPTIQNIRNLSHTLLAGRASWKGDLRKAQILLIFIYLQMYFFFVGESTM
jgi:hypothetical protein